MDMYEQAIQTSINRLSELGRLETYRGPRHPTSPNPQIGSEIASFLAAYPFLLLDQGYVAFLECYAGACSERYEASFWIELFGFTHEEVSLHIVDGPGDTVDDNGFLVFAYIALGDDSQGHLVGDAFAFDASGQRRRGVYRCKSGLPDYEWLCETFLEWLEKILSRELLRSPDEWR